MSGCKNKGARMATLRVTPDTGATVDVIKEDIAKQIGVDIEPNTGGYKLSDAQNANLKIVGTCKLRLQGPGGQWCTIKAMVTSKLSDSLLLSWSTQKFLGILPQSWPHELFVKSVGMGPRKLCGASNPVKIEVPDWPPMHFLSKMKRLCEKYADVLVEELPPGTKMYWPAMDIRMKENFQLYICKKPRPTPIHWHRYIDKEVKKLLREGIIERAHGRKITFCSPAHWVPKNKEETRFCLVTDLRKLNEAVIPDTSVFPSPARVMSQVNAASTWFVAVDLLSGYHQVAIKEEDKQYFAFMIDEGKQGGVFVYTVAPMGFCNSGHSFVNNLSLLLADLDVLSEVDDLLMEGRTEDEVLKKFEDLLIRCRKFNIKISR